VDISFDGMDIFEYVEVIKAGDSENLYKLAVDVTDGFQNEDKYVELVCDLFMRRNSPQSCIADLIGKSDYFPDKLLLHRFWYENNKLKDYLTSNKSNISYVNSQGESALYCASSPMSEGDQIYYINGIEYLIGRGFDVNFRHDISSDINPDYTESNITVLMKASFLGYPDIVKKLLALGADVSLKDTRGRTAYDYAILADREKIISILENWRF